MLLGKENKGNGNKNPTSTTTPRKYRAKSFWEQNKVAFAAVSLLIFTAVYLYAYSCLGETLTAITPVLLILVSLELLILFIPWERVSSLRVGDVALTLEQPKVKAAIYGLHIDNKKIKDIIREYSNELDLVKGSKILWIDDKPRRLVGERRLLRALGANIVPVISSREAVDTLTRSNDFDLIITNINRKEFPVGLPPQGSKDCNSKKENYGAEFIVQLRKGEDPIIRKLPVIFYTALSIPDDPNLNPIKNAINESKINKAPIPSSCIETDVLLRLVFEELSSYRSMPTSVDTKEESWSEKPFNDTIKIEV